MDKDLQIGSTQEAFARWFDLFVPKDYFLRFGISIVTSSKKNTPKGCAPLLLQTPP